MTHERFLSTRARPYLWAAGGRHLILGVVCLIFADDFAGAPSYHQIIRTFPLRGSTTMRAWGLVFLVVGAALIFGGLQRHEWVSRWALLAAIILTSTWAGGFLASFIVEPNGLNRGVAAVWCVTWGSLALKDALVLRSPVTLPFEGATPQASSRRVVT